MEAEPQAQPEEPKEEPARESRSFTVDDPRQPVEAPYGRTDEDVRAENGVLREAQARLEQVVTAVCASNVRLRERIDELLELLTVARAPQQHEVPDGCVVLEGFGPETCWLCQAKRDTDPGSGTPEEGRTLPEILREALGART